jgi:hypothetical protein
MKGGNTKLWDAEINVLNRLGQQGWEVVTTPRWNGRVFAETANRLIEA